MSGAALQSVPIHYPPKAGSRVKPGMTKECMHTKDTKSVRSCGAFGAFSALFGVQLAKAHVSLGPMQDRAAILAGC